uniref:Uncharacterized protein n=1 Tax=Leersia perrieri TaxID=77586 RepID=A0A0D9V3Z0_9ORYZ
MGKGTPSGPTDDDPCTDDCAAEVDGANEEASSSKITVSITLSSVHTSIDPSETSSGSGWPYLTGGRLNRWLRRGNSCSSHQQTSGGGARYSTGGIPYRCGWRDWRRDRRRKTSGGAAGRVAGRVAAGDGEATLFLPLPRVIAGNSDFLLDGYAAGWWGIDCKTSRRGEEGQRPWVHRSFPSARLRGPRHALGDFLCLEPVVSNFLGPSNRGLRWELVV